MNWLGVFSKKMYIKTKIACCDENNMSSTGTLLSVAKINGKKRVLDGALLC